MSGFQESNEFRWTSPFDDVEYRKEDNRWIAYHRLGMMIDPIKRYRSTVGDVIRSLQKEYNDIVNEVAVSISFYGILSILSWPLESYKHKRDPREKTQTIHNPIFESKYIEYKIVYNDDGNLSDWEWMVIGTRMPTWDELLKLQEWEGIYSMRYVENRKKQYEILKREFSS